MFGGRVWGERRLQASRLPLTVPHESPKQCEKGEGCRHALSWKGVSAPCVHAIMRGSASVHVCSSETAASGGSGAARGL